MWNGFWELHRFRAVNFGSVGAIPLTEIEAYIRIHGIKDKKEFISYVSAMDEEFLKFANESVKASKK